MHDQYYFVLTCERFCNGFLASGYSEPSIIYLFTAIERRYSLGMEAAVYYRCKGVDWIHLPQGRDQ
jgi:hypothetical protein